MAEKLHRILEERKERFVSGDLFLGPLRPEPPWSGVTCLAATDSTNRVALEMAEDGAPHGTVVVADSQTAGRGRMGRKWVSPPGKNLYLSLLLRPGLSAAEVPRISLVTGVALAETVESFSIPSFLKWPNDLFLGGRKAAGILAESASDSGGVRYVVIGVGINVNMEPDDFPDDLRAGAISLRIASGRRFSRVEVLRRFLAAFARRYDGFLAGRFSEVLDAWRARDFLRGRRVLARIRGEQEWGVALGVDGDGALRFLRSGGEEEQVQGGEIVGFER